MTTRRALPVLFALMFPIAGLAAPSIVPYDELLAAMKEVRGYDVLATPNGGRFQAEVLLRVARRELALHPEGGLLLFRQEDWFPALLATTGIEASQAPAFARLAWEHRQDFLADSRPGNVVREVVRGQAPSLALNVTVSWPGGPGAPEQYSYEDNLSTPRLKVTNKRVMTYRLLDYGDVLVFDEIEGLQGRPTSGALGLLFQVIGEGRVVHYRMAVAPDGRVVSMARARKAFIEIGTTVTVQPSGKSDKGVPPDPVLRALEKRIKAPLDIRYEPRS